MKTLILISFLLATACTFGQINDDEAFFEGTYSKEYIRKHRVATVAKRSYMDTNKFQTAIYYFDKKGFLQKQTIIDTNRVERPKFLFRFNKYGDLIQRITLPEDKYKADTFVVKRAYNKNRIMKESSTYSPLTTEHFYNERGDRIRTVHPYNNGYLTLSKRVVDYNYDEAGKLVHVTDRIYRGSADKIEQWMSDRTIIYEKDKIQKVIEKIPNGEFPTNRGNLEYSYDSSGNVISIISDTVVSYYFTYDEKGLLKSKGEKFPEGFDTLSDAKIGDEYTYTFRK